MQLSSETRMEVEDLALEFIQSRLNQDDLDQLQKQGKNWKDVFADLADDMAGDFAADFMLVVMQYFNFTHTSWRAEMPAILSFGDEDG